MCVVCALCAGVLWHSRTSALSHLADTALPTPARCHTGSHLPTAPCVPRCTTSAFCVVPHCLVLCTTLHCVCPAALLLSAWAQWAADLLQCTAPLPGRSGQWTSCNTLPHCRGAVGSGPPSMHCPTAWGQWAVELLQCTAPLPRGQWAVELLLYTASLPGGSGQWNSCNALPHCPGAVGSGTPAIQCRTAWGQWVVEPLQCTASLPWGQWAVDLLQCFAHQPGGTGSPAQGVVGVFFRAMGRRHRRRAGHTGPGGTGSPAQGVVGLSEGRREGRLDRVTGLFQGWRGRGWEGGHPAPCCAVLCCVVLRCVVGCAAMCCVLCCASAERAQVGLWACFWAGRAEGGGSAGLRCVPV